MEDSMILHMDKVAFQNAIRAAADHLGIRDIFVEKDYWVTYLLKKLSISEFSDKVVFKGGTSLSKAFQLINRFSEDVDLAILNAKDYPGNQIKNFIRSIEKELTEDFIEIELEGITSKGSRYRKTAYDYNKVIDTSIPTGIMDHLILEINSFGNPVPFEVRSINSLIGQFLNEIDNEATIVKYELEPYEVNVLSLKSTLIEKILSLVRLSFFEDRIKMIIPKVRHFYDIFFLSNSKFGKDYLTSEEFKEDFNKMYEEDKTKFNDPQEWLISSYKMSPIFTSFENVWSKVKDTYENEFKLLVYGEFPEEKKISEKFKEVIEILK